MQASATDQKACKKCGAKAADENFVVIKNEPLCELCVEAAMLACNLVESLSMTFNKRKTYRDSMSGQGKKESDAHYRDSHKEVQDFAKKAVSNLDPNNHPRGSIPKNFNSYDTAEIVIKIFDCGYPLEAVLGSVLHLFMFDLPEDSRIRREVRCCLSQISRRKEDP